MSASSPAECTSHESEGAVGKQDGDSVDDRIATLAACAANEAGIQSQRLAAYGAGKPSKVLQLENVRSRWVD
jgi:hypothetical protein